MGPIRRALWTIESHFTRAPNLATIARSVGVSQYHLARMFSHALGCSITGYMRARRLSLAARALAAGEPDILGLALSVGYSSHAAFTRAFRQQFGVTPEQVRRQGHTHDLELQEAIRMTQLDVIELDEPVLRTVGPLRLVGLARHYAMGGNADIPAQWQAFSQRIDSIPGGRPDCTYGVVHDIQDDDSHEYLAAIAAAPDAPLPEGLTELLLPVQSYVVFHHPGHISEVGGVCEAIFADWLPDSGYEVSEAPFFERYTEAFDPETGHGGFEFWLPVETTP